MASTFAPGLSLFGGAMEKDPENSEARPGPPPPDLPKGPPAPPPAPDIPDPAADRGASGPRRPPLEVSVARGSSGEGDAQDPSSGAPTGGGSGGDASLNDRVIGAVIDFLLAFGLSIAVSWLAPSFLDQLGTLLAVAYLLCRDSLPFLEGQSVGKRAVGTRAVTLDGQSLAGNWQPGIVRNVVLLIPFFAFVELFVLITRQDAPGITQRLGDEWARTKVINAPRRQAPEAEEGGGD